MTNADCIRRMNDEQLYDFLSEWECGDIDYSVTFCDLCNEATKRGEVGNVLNLDCDGCRKHWLQRDAVDFGGLMYWKRNTTFEADTPQTDWETEKRDNSLCYKCVKECDRRVLNRYTIECNQYEPKDEPQTDRPCDKCEWHKEYGRCIFEYCHYEYEQAHKDTPQTESKLTANENNVEIPTETENFTSKSREKSKLKQTDCGWK